MDSRTVLLWDIWNNPDSLGMSKKIAGRKLLFFYDLCTAAEASDLKTEDLFDLVTYLQRNVGETE